MSETPKNTYSTFDLYVASYLYANDCQPIFSLVGGRVMFTFEDNEQRKQALNAYLTDPKMQAFIGRIKELRSVMYDQLKRQHTSSNVLD